MERVMPGWKDRLTSLIGGGGPPPPLDPDLCLNPPSGFPASERARCCIQLIEHGDPTMRARFHNGLGLAYNDLKRLQDAIREISKAIELRPQANFLTNRAYMLEQAGETDAALADLARALELDPDHLLAYEDRADIYHELGRLEDALRDVDRALAKPTAYRHRLKGRLLMHLARYEEAIPCLDACLELNPSDANALERRATCHLMLDQPARAAADAEAALASKPDMRKAHLALATALDVDDPQRALHHFGIALTSNPDDGPTLNNRGRLLDRLGDRKGAEADFDRAVALKPDEPIFRNNRGLWRIETGDFTGATADLLHGLDRDPGEPSILCGLARLASIQGDHARAEDMLSHVLRHLPNYASAYAVLGWTRLAQRRFQEAAAAFDQALEQPRGRDPGKQSDRVRWEALYGRGLARDGLGGHGEDDRSSARSLRPDADQVVARWGAGMFGAPPASPLPDLH